MAEYIEREALLELYENTPDCNIDNLSVPVEVVRQNIKDMPTADVAPVVHGTWERKEIQIAMFGVTQVFVCTNCGYDHEYDEWFDRCPKCGAKMDGKEKR